MDKDEIYTYEGKSYTLKRLYYSDYLTKIKINPSKLYSIEDSEYIINKNVVAIYEGIFHPLKPMSGHDICILLSDVREQLEIRIDTLGENEIS